MLNQNTDSKEPLFGTTVWLLLGGVLLLLGGCCPPSLLDGLFNGLFNLFDFRTWPWWYFLCLIAVIAFSVRWFLLFQKKVNDEFDPQSREEAKWFCFLTGSATGLFAVLIILHRTGLLRQAYYTLQSMFGYGSFSLIALTVFTAIFVLIGLFAFLIWKWLAVIQID